MKALTTASLTLLISLHASAFSREEHIAITRLAVKNLNECMQRKASRLRTFLSDATAETMASANSFEDLAVWKKWTVASHFYNPIKSFDWGQNEPAHRGDADDALKRALDKYLDESRNGGEPLKRIGQMLHYIQDVSSPLHVMGVNHALSDGFENNPNVNAMAEAEDTPTSCVRVKDAREPLTILQMNATQTLKISDQFFNYRVGEDHRDRQARWTEMFYVNRSLTSDRLSSLLKRFDLLGKMFKLGPEDYPAGSLRTLPRGVYGPFADAKGLFSKKDNFGQTDFRVIVDGSMRNVHIERAEYVAYKKKLIHEAVEASQELIAWSLLNGGADLGH